MFYKQPFFYIFTLHNKIMTMNYKLFDKIFGWVAFLIAATVYLMTIEPTVSFWDCGEFISSSYKLEVGHPPGAPSFMLFGRIAALFASEPAQVAKMINSLSALASAATIMFLFWTISYFARRILAPDGKVSTGKAIAIIGASLVGSLVYTFSDTFWFSAVEGEVYASSSFFTAIVFWAILKWEQAMDKRIAIRWILLIAVLVGLSLGVHLLNLLAIPAMVLVYYFKNYKQSPQGVLISLGVSLLILVSIMYGVVPGVAKVAFQFELFFVNTLGMPYFSGVIVWIILLFISLIASLYFTQFREHKLLGTLSIFFGLFFLGVPFMSNAFLAVILVAGIVIGVYTLYDKHRHLLNTIMLAFTFILIGYSTFSIIVIRSLANPPMDQNNPDNMFTLLSYLNREQYGDRPLFYGEYYNSDVDRYEPYIDGKPIYHKKDGEYKVVGHKPIKNYDKDELTLFPRMYSPQPNHVEEYKRWANIRGDRTPTFSQNMRYFFSYQMGWMYWRYFMWNFAGRQNDIQGHGGAVNGNWISGIPAFDKGRVGDLDKMPDHMKGKAHNKYYMLPLILGLLGLALQLVKHPKDWWVVLALFILTGIAIVVYLNQPPLQPRERDYAYAGSFYAFSIWVGLGALAVYAGLRKLMAATPSAVLATGITLLVPLQMAAQNWDDHDRSNRRMAQAFAHNYLNSCEKNAILFTYGDNDTFPIWYAQEVEGVRTDVKVCCLPYFASNWYVDQMKMATYEAAPMPLSFDSTVYEPQKREAIYLVQDPAFSGYQPIDKVMDFIQDDKRSHLSYQGTDYHTYPTTKLILPVDSVNAIKNGIVKPEDAHLMENEIRFDFQQKAIMKNQMMFLDMLNSNNWERPVYFTSIGSENTMNLDPYFQHDGFAYRLTPIKSENGSRIDTDILYDNLMNNFEYGNMNDPEIYVDFTSRRTTKIVRLRQTFVSLANALRQEGDTERAIEVMNRCDELFPIERFKPDYFDMDVADAWYRLGEFERGDKFLTDVMDIYTQEIEYYFSFKKEDIQMLYREAGMAITSINECQRIAMRHGRQDIAMKANTIYSQYAPSFEKAFNMQMR